MPPAYPLKSDIAIGQFETGLFIVILLGNDTIQTNVSIFKIFKAFIPNLDTVTFAAVFWFDNVETKETKFIAILYS